MSRASLLIALLSLVAVGGGCDRGGAKAVEHADATPIVVVEQPGTPPEPSKEESPPAAEETVPGRIEIVLTDEACVTDSDCVKATCCHATTCVTASATPDCSTVACTADCRAGTMDCNGGCLCQAGKCAAKLWWAPSE